MRSESDDGTVILALHRANGRRTLVEHMLQPHVGWLQPLPIDDRRHANAGLRGARRLRGRDVDRDQELPVPDAALGTDVCAVARREQRLRRSRSTPARQAVRISGKQRAPKAALVETGGPPGHQRRELPGDASDVSGQSRPVVDDRLQIVRRAMAGSAGVMALGEHGARQRRFAGALGGQQDPREPRMERQAPHGGAHRGDARAAHRAQAAQQLERGVERVAGRRLEPREVVRIATPRQHGEDHGREIDAMNLCLGAGPQAVRRVPQPPDRPGGNAAGAPGALIGRVLRDALDLEAVDRPGRIVARYLVQPGVHDGTSRPARSARSRRYWWPGSRGGVPPPSAPRPVRRPTVRRAA